VATEPPPGPSEAPGLLASLRRLAATTVDILRTRLELLAVELQEEGLRLAQIAIMAVVALFFLVLGVIMLTLLLVVLFWETHRVMVVALLAAGYLGLGVAIAFGARSRLRTGTKLFAASLAELSKDRERLRPPDA
jgi:uncharacterized membrane protein YqjE